MTYPRVTEVRSRRVETLGVARRQVRTLDARTRGMMSLPNGARKRAIPPAP